MVVEVPKGLLGHAIEEFEMLLGRAVDFLGLHPHEFPKDEHLALESLRGLLVQLKSVAGLLGQDEEEDLSPEPESEEIPIDEPVADLEDDAGKEEAIEPESKEPIDVEDGDLESRKELEESPQDEEVEEPIIEVEEEKLDEEVEAEIEKDEVQEEAGKESREKIEALEAQLAALKKTMGD